MPRLRPINPSTAPTTSQNLLADVEERPGMAPNMITAMAQSAAVAQAYLEFSQGPADGVIPKALRERIPLAVSQANRCGYCVAAHSAIGSSVGLTENELRDARSATSLDRRIEAVLQFARRIVERRGAVSDDEVAQIRNAGHREPEIVEVIGHVALSMFTNYFNLAAQTKIDFPPVADLKP